MDGAHNVGSGENAHLWADELRRAVDLEDDTGRPLVLEVAAPLHPANQRLMDTLGVEVRVVTPIARQESRELVARTEGNYVVPAAASANGNGHGPRTDWIDYRASVARVHKREQAGDEALVCPGCGTETDVTDVVHSPKCKSLARAPEKASDWDRDSVIAALRANAKDGVAPAGSDWYTKADGRPTYAIVQRVFGSWPDAVEAAGLERAQRGHKARRSSADEVGGAEVGNREGDDEPQVSVRVARSSSADGEETASAGQDGSETSERVRVGAPDKPRGWSRKKVTPEAAIESLRRVADELGRTPYCEEWKRLNGRPAQSTFHRLFGGWDEAVAAAGLPPAVSPGRKRTAGRAGGASKTASTRQEPPIVWAVKVPGTGLHYRTVDEALVAADEIEHDGERVARQARVDGQEGRADQAIDASRELAQKIREAAGQDSREPAVPPSAVPARERPVTSQQPTLSDGEIAVAAAVRDLDPLTLTGEQTAGWIARLEAESERLHRRAEAFDTIAEGLRQLQETDV